MSFLGIRRFVPVHEHTHVPSLSPSHSDGPTSVKGEVSTLTFSVPVNLFVGSLFPSRTDRTPDGSGCGVWGTDDVPSGRNLFQGVISGEKFGGGTVFWKKFKEVTPVVYGPARHGEKTQVESVRRYVGRCSTPVKELNVYSFNFESFQCIVCLPVCLSFPVSVLDTDLVDRDLDPRGRWERRPTETDGRDVWKGRASRSTPNPLTVNQT